MLRRFLLGGVAAALLATNTGCHCLQSFLCYCWNEMSPCHWGCDPAFGWHGCDPCDSYGNWTGGCDSCGGSGCSTCDSGGGPGPYLAEGQPSYTVGADYQPRIAARGAYGYGDGQIVPGSEVWTEGPAPAGSSDTSAVAERPSPAPYVAERPRTVQRSPARPAAVAQRPVPWSGEPRRAPPARTVRKASYSKYR